MALPPAFLDELRARTPLHGLIGRRTRLTKSGRNWKGCCPFHNEKTPSFYVYDDHFHCFGCGAHGDAVTFVMRAEGAAFPEAVERLAAEAGMEVPKPTAREVEREQRARDQHAIMDLAARWFMARLREAEGAPALDYLKRRGLTEETIARFGLGWSGPGRGALVAMMKAEGVEAEELVELGLLREGEGGEPPREFFFNRVMFPIRDRRGRTIAFGGRIMGDGQPKYINSPETPLYRKRFALYGLDLAREAAFRGARVVAVEGYMDVIALHQAGFGGAIAPLGTALTQEQLGELWRLSPEPFLCFDGDAAGGRAAARAAELALSQLAPERTIRIATLPAGEDPDTLILKGGPQAFDAVLDAARPLHDAVFSLLAESSPRATPEQRATFRNRLDAAARTIPDKALAAEYRRSLLDRFFAMTRRQGGPAPRASRQRPAIAPGMARPEQARILLTILLRHPWMLPQMEEPLAALDLPAGQATLLRDAFLAWQAHTERLDAEDLIAHLRSSGQEEPLAWLTRPDGLPLAARAEAQPSEAEDGFWHFFLRLRGEGALIEDQREALKALAETNDPAAQQRLIRLTEALTALRSGEEAQPHGGGTDAPP